MLCRRRRLPARSGSDAHARAHQVPRLGRPAAAARNGTDGLERAGDYVAAQFKAAGLEPGGTDDSWFQPFELIAGLRSAATTRSRSNSGGTTRPRRARQELLPAGRPRQRGRRPRRHRRRFDDLPLVFAGYGLVAPSIGYDDYRRPRRPGQGGADLQPRAAGTGSQQPAERHAADRADDAAGKSGRGAANAAHARCIVVADPVAPHRRCAVRAVQRRPGRREQRPIPVLRVRRDEREAAHRRLGARRRRAHDRQGPDAALAGAARRHRRLRRAPGAQSPHGAERRRRAARQRSGACRRSRRHRRALRPCRASAAACRSTPDRTGEIHNGADDNASGTAAIIEMARAAARSATRFPRTLVFVAFAGEERGLLGLGVLRRPTRRFRQRTRWRCSTSTWSDVRVAGWTSAGSRCRRRWRANLKRGHRGREGRTDQCTGRDPGAGRSDDSSFIDRRIPAINFFTGFHDDYHRTRRRLGEDRRRRHTAVATLALELAASWPRGATARSSTPRGGSASQSRTGRDRPEIRRTAPYAAARYE